MNKFYFIFCFVLLCDNMLSAQTEKGTWLLGGSASLVASGGSSSISINPSVGYFVLNHLAGGAQVNFIGAKSGSFLSIGPYAKYYIFGDEKGRFYASAGLNIGGGSKSKFDTGYSLGAGYALFLNESISLDMGMLYNKIGTNGGIFSLGAGFQVHFNRLRGSRLE